MLTDEMDRYRTDGYVVTPILSHEDVARVLAEANKLQDLAATLDRSAGDFNLEAPDGGFAGQDGSKASYPGLLRKVRNVVCHSLVILYISQRPSMVGLARRMLGVTNCHLAHSVLWYKPPRVGSAKPPHQDAPYLDGDPERYVTIWTALDECTLENGCLEVVPGSHVYGPVPHEGDEARVSADHWDFRPSTAVPLRPGAAIAFHPCLLHASSANRSDRPRRALMLRYVALDAHAVG